MDSLVICQVSVKYPKVSSMFDPSMNLAWLSPCFFSGSKRLQQSVADSARISKARSSSQEDAENSGPPSTAIGCHRLLWKRDRWDALATLSAQYGENRKRNEHHFNDLVIQSLGSNLFGKTLCKGGKILRNICL